MSMRGRWYRWDKRSVTTELLSLDMSRFAKAVDMTTASVGSWSWTWTSGRADKITYAVMPGRGVRLAYTVGGQAYDFLVSVTTTVPHYGGVRYWWLCPACGRRCRVLYDDGRRFVCWRCSGAYYETQQNKSALTKIDNELSRLRKRFGAEGRTEALPDKPKWMHYTTYARLATRYVQLQHARLAAFRAEVMSLLG